MAAPAPALPGNYHLRVTPHSVEMGGEVIDSGNPDSIEVHESPGGNQFVRIRSTDAMGLLGKECVLDFYLQNKVSDFVRGFIEQTKATFKLCANLIKPEIKVVFGKEIKSQGYMRIKFETSTACKAFSWIAPIYFPAFDLKMNETELELTGPVCNKPPDLNGSLDLLDARTGGAVNELLYANHDHRFPGTPPVIKALPPIPDFHNRPAHYHFTPIGIFKDTYVKATVCYESRPLDPFKKTAQADRYFLESVIAILEKHFGTAGKWHEEMLRRLDAGQPNTSLEMETINNLLDSPSNAPQVTLKKKLEVQKEIQAFIKKCEEEATHG